MFKDFAHIWTPVCMASRLRREQPLAVQVAGTRVVLFRSSAGAPVALLDRCPHRGVALSLGKVRQGQLECPFHGWRFGTQGAVCHVPWNPDAKLPGLHAVTIAARELAGLIWIYTAPEVQPAHEPLIAPVFLRPEVRVAGADILWNTHWTRAMENMLDWPHLPFVHQKTIGKGMLKRPEARMDIRYEEQPWGLHSTVTIDGQEQEGALDLRWPNQMNLFIPIPRRTLVMKVVCIPEDDQRTRMLLITARSFLRWRLLDPVFHRMNLRIANEDKAIVESSQPPAIPPAGEEKSVRTDGMTLLFRKRYFKELHGTPAADPAAQGRRPLPVLSGDPP